MNIMNEQFVTYEIASQLEELGFRLTREESFGRFTMKGELVQMPFLVAERTIVAPLWQQVIDWCDSKGLLVGTIVVDNLYKSTINKINYETKLFHSRNESIKRAIEFAISYLQDNK